MQIFSAASVQSGQSASLSSSFTPDGDRQPIISRPATPASLVSSVSSNVSSPSMEPSSSNHHISVQDHDREQQLQSEGLRNGQSTALAEAATELMDGAASAISAAALDALSSGTATPDARDGPFALSQQQESVLRLESPSLSPSPSTTGQVCSNCGTTRTPLWRRAPDGKTICNACGLYLKARNAQRPTNLKRPSTLGTVQTGVGATYVAAEVASGTCPGGGKCNGTGGAVGCSGCPAYNNRVAKAAQLTPGIQACSTTPSAPARQTTTAPSTRASSDGNTTVVIACQNCGTTITPLWRRDEAGHTICNACGLFYKLHGVHRPQAMMKTIIKRRKRVVAPLNGHSISCSPLHAHAQEQPQQQQVSEALSCPLTNNARAQSPTVAGIQQLASANLQHAASSSSPTIPTSTPVAGVNGQRRSRQPNPNVICDHSHKFGFRHYAPPIDFTAAFRPGSGSSAPVVSMNAHPHSSNQTDDVNLAPIQEIGPGTQSGFSGTELPSQGTKRTLSMANGEIDDTLLAPNGRMHTSNSIHSILNPRSAEVDVPIEPSLLAMGTVGVVELAEEQRRHILQEKKMNLEREVKKLREMIDEYDRELETLKPQESGSLTDTNPQQGLQGTFITPQTELGETLTSGVS